MKTSKRLLSILLMLTMLLSMFTVMASASVDPTDLTDPAGTEDPCEWGHNEDSKTDAVHYPATEGDCITKATREYWKCKKCGKYFWQDDVKYITSDTRPEALNVNPNVPFALKYVAAKAATCAEAGNIEHWHCSGCGKNYDSADATTEITVVTIPATGKHKLEQVVEKEPTCTEDGYEAYWECSVCGQKFSDKGQTKIDTPVKVNKTGHAPILMAGTTATCTEEGRQPYYMCKTCQKEFKDAACTQEITDASWKTIPKTAHQLTKTNEVPATCTKDGTKAYWTCSVCGKNFEDEACTKEIDDLDTWKVVAKLGHTWGEWKKNAAGTKETRECSVCHTKEERTIAKEYDVTVKVNNSMRGQVNYIHDGTTTEDISRIAAVKGQEIKLKAVSADSDKYKFGYWVVTGVSGLTSKQLKNETLTFTMPAKAVTVKAVFILKPVDDDYYWLELDIGSHGSVEFKDDGTWTDVDDEDYLPLERGETYKFRADPDSGYKTVWQLDDGSKYTGNTFSFKMGRYDRVLHVSFVKKNATVEDDYPTLTFDITGGKHGTVYRGTREYEDGDVISIKKNDKMTFKAKADKGYVAVWTYKGDTYVGDEYTVKMGATDAKLYVEFMDKDDIRLTELPFRDVSKRDWYYDDVVYVYRKGYMDGMSSTRFGGELNTTRGQIVTILWRLTGEPRATKRNPFTDVSSSQYYYDAISWAYDAGVVDGFDARTFKPDQNVTREQLAAILYRYAKYMNLSTSGSAYLAKYRDADKIASWAYDAMAWANYRGLINGTSATRIDPKGYATRAQIAAILHRFAVEYGA